VINLDDKKNPAGIVQINDDVIASIARVAALEAEGIAGMAGKLYRKKGVKGVTVITQEDSVLITLDIVIQNTGKMQDIAKDVQQKVKTAIETMTNYTAKEVNIHIAGIVA
jgi:uncharacterized alkaline shock family protein YloU